MHPHLQEHVRHVDIWVPVWERRNQDLISMRSMATTDDPYQGYNMQPVSSNYRLSSNGASIEEMFHLIQVIFKKACVLTIEGGACKKPPRIPMTRCVDDFLPELSNIKTLVLKGTWTMIRDSLDLSKLASALPNLKDWQFMFASPKYYAYILMHALVPKFSAQLTHLHICMDGFYSKKWLNPTKVENLRLNHHLCASLGKLLLQLEALTFSGRACYSIFTAAIESCSRTPTTKPRLKSLDLALRNCCRDRRNEFGERMGMYNWGFINAFEKLVVTATASLKFFANLASMRIRFVDLDSPMASLNPYFQIKDQTAYGLYSEDILYHLNSLPIPIDLAEESISEDQQGISIQEKRTSGRRPNRIHISEYGNLGSIR